MDIYSLLDIKSDVIRDFPILANRVVDHQMELVLTQQTRTLRQIEENMSIDKGLKVSKQSIDEIIYKVLTHSKTSNYSPNDWTMRELRIVSYYLMKLRGYDDAYKYALSLLDKNWRNLYFNGLVFLLMNSWNSLEEKYKTMTCNLLVTKLQDYNDNNRRYLLFKNHCNLFEEAGPSRMAALINRKNMDLDKAPCILGFRPSSICQSYYSDVIIQYIKDKDIHDLEIIERIFEYAKLDRTRKLVLAHLVNRENSRGNGLARSQLCRFINRILGDVTLASTWAPFIGATLEEAETLRHSMKLVNNWFAQQIIESFFELCVQDPRRRNFWLQYVEYLDGFKIVSSESIKSMLRSDPKIGNLFINHFINTSSYSSQTSALVLFFKDKMIVEFSDTGAVYVYNHNHPQVRLLNKKMINSTNDLKVPSMDRIVETDDWGYHNLREQGKLSHIGMWEGRLKIWMEKMLLHKDNYYSLYASLQKDDQVFKANPLPVEEIKEVVVSTAEPVTKHSMFTVSSSKVTTKVENKTNPFIGNFQEEKILSNIPIRVVSNVIYGDIYVTSNDNGFYLYQKNGQRFILIRNFKTLNEDGGSIKIAEAKAANWYEIIHYKNGTKGTIGFLKEAKLGNGYLFKERMEIAAKRRLKFY